MVVVAVVPGANFVDGGFTADIDSCEQTNFVEEGQVAVDGCEIRCRDFFGNRIARRNLCRDFHQCFCRERLFCFQRSFK